ncbi:MAG: hypothetical protein CMH83_17510 [Nocardioides sp.]|nr:hypothetical protein [Nocardioides sp.]
MTEPAPVLPDGVPRGTLHVLTPTYRPAGGVVKLMDYARHARAMGLAVQVWSPQAHDPDGPLFAIERLRDLVEGDHPTGPVRFHSRQRLAMGPDDLALISLPDNYEVALRSLPAGGSPHRVVHLVQNTRHTNPTWRAGYPTRLLTRPASRICVNHIVADEIEPWVDPRALLAVNNIGHDTAYFRRDRSPGLRERPGPVRVAYTTWKSAVGDRVAERLADDDRFELVALRETASWAELRELYHHADVFLSTPEPQEGMYLPGLEAMAAGCVVLTPDVGGNMAYCRPGDNCVLVAYDDPGGYVAALERLVDAPAAEVDALRASGWATLPHFDLAAEAEGLAGLLGQVWSRVRTAEA